MTNNNRIVPLKGGKKSDLLTIAEEISQQGIMDALGAARFAYERRLEALRESERNLKNEYLAEVARIIND